MTSTVLPLAPVSTSPGRESRAPPGMFSTVGITPITRHGAPSSAIARIAAATAAPPDMSSFIRSMPSAGLIEMPPGIERHAFAHEPEHGRRGRVGRLVAQ